MGTSTSGALQESGAPKRMTVGSGARFSQLSLLRPEDSQPIVTLLEQFGELHERGPGIRIRKGVARDMRTNALFIFDIWDQFRFHGAAMNRD